MNGDLEDLADGMSPTARKALSDYLETVAKFEKQIENTALSILVWGPGQLSDPALYEKRCQIRDKLCDLGHAAIFSEDIHKSSKEQRPAVVLELAQAISADLIVVLLTSWGPLAEATAYGYDAEIGSKMIVLMPEEIRDSFADQAIVSEFQPKVVYFTQAELERSDLVTKVIELLAPLKYAKFMYLRQKRRWEGLI
jgi:hypothetical protein